MSGLKLKHRLASTHKNGKGATYLYGEAYCTVPLSSSYGTVLRYYQRQYVVHKTIICGGGTVWALCKFKVLKRSVWMVSIVTSAVLPARKEMIFPAQPENALCNSFRHRARHDGRERLRLLFVRLDHEVPDV